MKFLESNNKLTALSKMDFDLLTLEITSSMAAIGFKPVNKSWVIVPWLFTFTLLIAGIKLDRSISVKKSIGEYTVRDSQVMRISQIAWNVFFNPNLKDLFGLI